MLTVKYKQLFFDRAKVVKALDRVNRRYLARGGRYVQKVARSSMKRRKGPSDPGEPPNVHEGSLRKLLYFVYDPPGSMLIGPVGRRGSNVPAALEFGGKSTSRVRVRRGQYAKKVVQIDKRPYMRPALDKSKGKLSEIYAQSIRG